jgi:hypothetical protein
MIYITTYPQVVPTRLTLREQRYIHYKNVFTSHVSHHKTFLGHVDLTSASMPDRLIIDPFHTGSLSATLSSNGCGADLGSLPIERGIPKYLIGKSICWQGKIEATNYF